MGVGKWITGAIGWALGGPLGGLAGYLIGSLFEGDSQQAQRVYTQGGYSANEQRNSFLVSLLVLSAAVICRNLFSQNIPLRSTTMHSRTVIFWQMRTVL